MDVINWLNCIWLTDLPSNSKYLACYLRKFMNSNNDIAWPSYSRIIEETGLARSTVAKYLKILESEGWIQRESGNSNTNTVYIASMPKDLQEKVKSFDDDIQKHLKGSSSQKLRGTSDEPHVVRHANTNKQCNKQSNNQRSDISKADDTLYSLSETVTDGLYEFPLCRDAIYHLDWINQSGRGKVYTGPLKWSEWRACEDAMRSVDCFDTDYFTWWIKERGESFRKTPSLPNMLCDFEKTGTYFEQFYNSTFGQEWEGE